MRHDHWYLQGPLLLKYFHRLIDDTASSLQAKLYSVITGNSWNWPAARSNSAVEVQSYLFEIHPCQERSNIVVWTPSKSGKFHSGATWYSLRAHSSIVSWYGLIWYKGNTPKHSFIAWLAILNRLSTKDRLAR